MLHCFAHERGLKEYANGHDVDVEGMDWVHIKEFPVSMLENAADKEKASAWWKANNDGMTQLLEDEITLPLLVGFYEDGIEVWDGELEAVASALTDRPTMAAVVGVEKGCDLSKLPELVREAVMATGVGAPKL